ncbi:efflux RND transporter permease subunit [Vibrio sp. JC009]|uniref:efflux RND transporter permease subunit n=1 Tax=Vibrio sp. JC009 TaxID=2912314 RepID=UPI0023B0D6D6|nr:efflux RND transporter permease subunit [Vibrio sp. JC009]WED23023.1 efflux RND transporter permease subunit [Vibrio sp. JC009]
MQDNATNQGIIAWFTRNPVAANLLMVLILVAGLISASNLSTESLPSIPPNSVFVDIQFNSGSAESAEEGIALKIEDALQGIAGIKRVDSTSTGQNVSVTITKTSGYDLDKLYEDVKNQINAINTLPQDAETPVIERAVRLRDVIFVNLYGEAEDQVLQKYAEELRSKLLANSKIQKVNYIGHKDQEIIIQVDESKLQAVGLSLLEVADKVSEASVTDTGGELDGETGKLILKTEQQRKDAKGFASIPLKLLPNGSTVYLSDVADVIDGFADKNNLTRYNGQPSVGLDIKMYGNSDISAISEETKRVVNEFRTSLPTGVNVELWNDMSEPIKDRLSLLMNNSFQGVFLVTILLAIFLNIRVALWVGLGLPVIFSGAMLLMGESFFGMTLNELTTFGLIMALGIVVDDAVVIGESIYEQREKQGATIESTIRGAQRVAIPTTFGVMTTIVAFVSISFVEGTLGQMFAQFAYAATFCLLFSLIESKLILPAHLAHLKMSNKETHNYWSRFQNKLLAGLDYFTHHHYKPFLAMTLQYRYAALAIFVSAFILVVGAIPSGKIKSVFFPQIAADSIQLDVVFKDDAGFGIVQREALDLERLAMTLNTDLKAEYSLEIDPIQSLLTETTDNTATITASLSSTNERPFTANEVVKRWQSRLPPQEGIESLSFSADQISEKGISIELRSRDSRVIELAGKTLMKALEQFNGVSGIKSGMTSAQTQVNVNIKPEGLAMGLSNTDLILQLKLAFMGYEIQRLQKDQNEVKVKIQYPDKRRDNLEDLQYTQIRLPNGQVVPLTSVASLETSYVSTTIERTNYSRVNLVTADVDKSAISPEDVIAKLDSGLFQQLEAEYRDLDIVISGQQMEKNDAIESLIEVFAIAMIAIFALLAIPLKSYLQPIIIMCAIPFGIVGALLGHMLHGQALSLLSLFGILALSGVVVNDSLLLISRYNSKRNEGLSVMDALLESGTGRLRAILLTSTTTYFGLVPLLAETTPQAQYLIPAATSMGYGILFATVITLVLIPALVMVHEDLNRLINWFGHKENPKDKRELSYE